ncbi:MAG: hypothetical protein Q9159_006155 [Coniocarpon cinnabarinum]
MQQQASISRIYCLLFLSLEPLTALAGAYYAYFYPSSYLNLTFPGAPFNFLPDRLPPSVDIVLKQLSNLYLLFAFNEFVVLRMAAQAHPGATKVATMWGMEWRIVDSRVWRAVLTGMLIADLGHLWSVRSLGSAVYYDMGSWNKMAWGNVGIVYAGMLARICFLSGLGVRKVEDINGGEKKRR